MRRGATTLRIACTVLALVVGSAACASAAAGSARGLDEAPTTGARALIASAAYPGLGQLLNGSEIKAAAIGVAEAYLIGRLVLEDRWTRHSLRRHRETGERSYYDDYERHFDRRQTTIWWLIVVGLYSLTDAYVDAHLSRFDEPVSPSIEAGFAGRDAEGFRLGVCWDF